jgi:glycosyltransferase involved in cell wall biosynthesis
VKVLYLSPTICFDGPFGDSIRIREIISNLALKNEVTVIAPTIKNVNHKALRIFYFKRLRKLKRHSQISGIISALVSLARLPNVQNYDIIFETFAGPFGVASGVKKLFHLPIVIELHGIIEEEERMHNIPRFYTDIIHPKLIKRTLDLADGIVAVTEEIKKKLCETYKIKEDKIRVIPNGVNTSIFKPMDQSIVRRDLNLDEDYHYIGFVGNLAPWQGVEYLIKVAPVVIESYKEKVKFLIVGDGIMKEKLIKMVVDAGLSDSFIFTGKVRYEVVPKYINSCDFCVAPFKPKLASPLKIFEYMACGKAVIASAIPHVAEILSSSNAGLLVSPEDSNYFAGAMIELLTNNELRQTLGKNGLNEVKRNHEWKIRADKLNAFLEDILHRQRASTEK